MSNDELITKETPLGIAEEQGPPPTPVPPARLAAHPTVGRGVRTRLLVLLLSLTTISVLAVAYLGVKSVQSVGQSAQQTSDEALRAQAEEYLRQLTVGDAQRNDLILKRVQRDAENVAQYAAGIFERPGAFTGGVYWQAEDHMFTGPNGQYMNDETDVSDVFVPHLVDIEDELLTVLELSAYLDFILVPTYESDPSTVAIYMGTEQDVLRYYPNINIGTIVPPDFQVTQRPWYINSVPENNPERKAVWSPVYVDATGKGLMVTAAAPIYTSQDEFIGVIGIDTTLRDISANVEAARLLGGGYSFLIDDTGHAIALPEQGYQDVLGRPAEYGEFGTDLSGSTTEFVPVLAKMMAGSTGFEALEVGGRELLVAYAPLESTGWSLANVVDANEVFQAMVTLQEELETSTRSLVLARILPVGGGILAVVLIIGLLLTNRLVDPIQRLATAAQQIGAGQWDAPLPRAGNDEIGVLSQAFATMTAQLRELMEGLEQRVAERTRGLQAAAEVSHATTSVLDPEKLLRQVVDLVCERFNLYYVGLFLVDEEQRFAVLRAGTGEAGRQMLAQEHRLEVGGESMIGQCVARAEARIALDVGEEAVRFDNPLLPETHSEMALPLRSRGQIIGAMTVQSVEKAAFDEADIAVLQTMADQVAVAIDNARLFAEAQAALGEMEAAHRRYLGQAWAEYALTRAISGYEQTGAKTMPLGDEVLPETQQAMTEQRPVVWRGDPLPTPPAGAGGEKVGAEESSPSALVVPIVLQGQPIGALGFKEAEGRRQWSAEDVALAEAIAEQLALAADNLRLFQTTQKALGETEALYHASQAIGAATSVEEVGQALIDFAATSGVDAVRILLFEHDEQEQLAYIVMREGWTVDNRPVQPYGTRLSLENYPLAGLMDPNEPIIVEDVLTDPRANEMTRTLIAAISGLRSFIMVPIIVGERWIGMIFAGRSEPSNFAGELIRGYWTLAGQAAIALESKRLLKETQRRAARERLTSEITARMRETLDMATVLKTAAQEVRQALGLPEVVVRLAPQPINQPGEGRELNKA